MKKIILILVMLINLIVSYFVPVLYSNIWFLIFNIIFSIFVFTFFIFVPNNFKFSISPLWHLSSRPKILMTLIFFWSCGNLILTAIGFNVSAVVTARKIIKSVEIDKTVPFIVEPKTNPVLIGTVIGHPQFYKSFTTIDNARIVLKNKTNQIVFNDSFTDKMGKFKIIVNVPQPENNYNLYITHSDYHPYFSEIKLIPGITNEIEIMLIPK